MFSKNIAAISKYEISKKKKTLISLANILDVRISVSEHFFNL